MLENYIDKVKRYYQYTKEEKKAFWIGTIGLTFILAFDISGQRSTLPEILKDLIIALIITTTALYAHHAGQRLWGLRNGMKVRQELWWTGIVIALIIWVLSNGKAKFFAVSGTLYEYLKTHRLGYFRYQPMFSEMAVMLIMGPLSNLLIGGLAKTIEVAFFPGNNILIDIFRFNTIFALYNMLPIPPLDGSKVFFWSRLGYSFIMGSLLGYVLLSQFFGIDSYLLSLVIGVVCWLTFYFGFEKEYRSQ
ncbi:hypothetical protein HY486_03390 [Candidatus Woesearchaeota archaeon]|nr:hypothetical protein [Candidatus Woesearchaeota archaeon]